jgi:hypothetical protein
MLEEKVAINTENITGLDFQREKYYAPIPSVLGDSVIEIISHSLIRLSDRKDNAGKGVSIVLKNNSDADIGRLVLKSTFFDINGAIVYSCESSIKDILKQQKRLVNIEVNALVDAVVYSYHVQIKELVHTPVPTVTGNDKINILKHSLRDTDNDNPQIMMWSYIDICIRNISNDIIASAIFDAVLYDSEGNVLDKIKHRECEIHPDHSRMITIATNKVKSGTAKSYRVNLTKTINSDVEKFQLKGYRINTTVHGEEISGTVKNISKYKSDAILVATFKDYKDDNIGVRVYSIKDVEPGAIRNFHFIFNPPDGEVVRKISFEFAEVITDL